ncbi:hypothetical protein GDO81_021716 [Engystomops pustulosus]|uniref:Uncharacterized protein n=1 Tax=Engystomops pustulosus TaxID=76066 RepID=A0AAV6YVF8_ENGPU|nr:hypothetical protein GDO81_021716 [Engystomops pustulosus]
MFLHQCSSSILKDSPPALTVAVVPRLPRGALVEWHVMAAVSDPDGRRNISVTEKAPQPDSLDHSNVSQIVKTVLQKASVQLPKNSSLIPVCCRVFRRSDDVELQSLTAGR